ncbi:MFS transporter, partial [Globicatella sulfidifaciens]
MSKLTYRHTIIACFMAYVVQSMVINYVPLLFVQFQNEFSVDLVQITALVSLNFLVQLMADALSIPIIKWIGYRWVAILAHLLAVLGFAAMALLPNMISSNPYIGLVIATALYSAGGGLIEVVSNPILEEIPTDNNERMMSLMHSFYSWGFVAVTIIAMSYFYFVGIEQWRVLTFFWCIIPLLNMILFIFVPLPTIIEGTAEGGSMMGLLTNQAFWIFSVMMFCAGASEMALSQW